MDRMKHPDRDSKILPLLFSSPLSCPASMRPRNTKVMVAAATSSSDTRQQRRGSHWCSVRRRPLDGCGEMALMQAVLDDAVRCFRQYSSFPPRYRPRVAREATSWLFADDEQWPFSCVNICAVLGIDPAYLRRKLMCEQAEALMAVAEKQRARLPLYPPPPEAA